MFLVSCFSTVCFLSVGFPRISLFFAKWTWVCFGFDYLMAFHGLFHSFSKDFFGFSKSFVFLLTFAKWTIRQNQLWEVHLKVSISGKTLLVKCFSAAC